MENTDTSETLGDEYEQWLDELDENEEQKTCPQCGGQPMLLGKLGNITHLRCRACGWDFTK
jgi:hypothetical protein